MGFGKPDATGRSSGKLVGRQRKLMSPPKNEPWVWQTRELMTSDAWKYRSVNVARLIDFLEVEHMNHAGTENGNLIATHTQLVEWGVCKRLITEAIDEAIYLGLIRVKRGGRWAGKNDASRFYLTYYADKFFSPPTNDWKARSKAEIKQWKQEKRSKKKVAKAAKKKNSTLHKVRYRTPPNEGTRAN
jgi:hypothetical protein